MSRNSCRFALIWMVATVIAAIGSHEVASCLHVKTRASEPFTIGKANGKPSAFLAGSSIADYGISWERISTQLDLEIKVWGIAAGSPIEFEQFQKQVPEARTTFIVVSVVDLDEAAVSDFRAAIVPIGQSIQNLRAIHADWNHSKRALAQYPLTWLRTLFPTLGRSRAIMGMLHQDVANLVKPSGRTSAALAGPAIKFTPGTMDDEFKRQRMSDWPEAKIIGKLVADRVSFQGPHSFNGPKRQAFNRMLQYADERGRTMVLVLPVSPAYAKEFMPPEMVREFEGELAGLQQAFPRVEWLRLDELPGLASPENFCDLDHLNVFGRQIATDAFLAWLKPQEGKR